MTNYTGRLTFQATRTNKVTVFFDRIFRELGHAVSPGDDPATASARRLPEHSFYATEQAKWTSTFSNKLLLETGMSIIPQEYLVSYLPGVGEPRGSAAWYAKARRVDLLRGTATTAAAPESSDLPMRESLSTALSYVTGSHAVKTGIQWGFGKETTTQDGNADLQQVYLNGAPSFVDVFNTPNRTNYRLNADLGIYAQDSWTLKRLTVQYGVRIEYFNASLQAQDAPPGRFAPARHFAPVSCLPCWSNVAPRFGVVYDLLGGGNK